MRLVLAFLALMVLLTASAAADDWPQFLADETHQGAAAGNTEFTVFKQSWWNNISIPATIKGSPVVKDGRVFVGGWDSNTIYALDSESGGILWKNSTTGKILGSPAVSESTVFVVTETGTLTTFNARTGTKEREVTIGGGTFGSPSVHERRLFVPVGTNDANGKMTAFDTDSLTKVWEFPVSSASGLNAKYFNQTIPDGQVEGAPAIYNGQVIFGSTNHWLYSVAEQGLGGGKTTLNWVFQAGGSIRSSPSIDKANSRVLFGAQDGKLYSVSLAGSGYVTSSAWTHSEFAGPSLASQIQSSAAIMGDKAFVGVNNANVIAVWLTNGTAAWTRPTGGQVISSPAVANGFVVVGSNDGTFYMMHAANGTVAWSRKTSSAIESSPAITKTQAFWAATDGSLYSYGGTKPQRADLQVTSFSGSLTVGQSGTLVASILNAGDQASPATTAQFYQGSQLLGAVQVAALEKGASTTAVWPMTAGSAGAFTFKIVVDPTNEIREYDKSNNIVSQTFTVNAPPATTSSSGQGPGFGFLLLAAALLAGAVVLRRRQA